MKSIEEGIERRKSMAECRFQALESQLTELETSISICDITLENYQAQLNNSPPKQPLANPKNDMCTITLPKGSELPDDPHPSQTCQEKIRKRGPTTATNLPRFSAATSGHFPAIRQHTRSTATGQCRNQVEIAVNSVQFSAIQQPWGCLVAST